MGSNGSSVMVLVVGAVVMAVALLLGQAGSGSVDEDRSDIVAGECAGGPGAPTRLAAYEWRRAAWRGAAGRGELRGPRGRSVSTVCTST